MTEIDLALGHAFLRAFHTDHANAATHCARVQYSPLTFRLAEALEAFMSDAKREDQPDLAEAVAHVVAHRGRYREDQGR